MGETTSVFADVEDAFSRTNSISMRQARKLYAYTSTAPNACVQRHLTLHLLLRQKKWAAGQMSAATLCYASAYHAVEFDNHFPCILVILPHITNGYSRVAPMSELIPCVN
ncbi:hypothetical protein WM2015_878 [Wenzhouxiangella marina]|uniref:Uncharacterized protein n=1 Tax=Wenzhouxiangella marina TaxID=1579979 RepID=A0A0K0XU78_9GAMM|nr:hypothetical protein WM2015_878 [Wenzhouxiangella marina]